jgi:hypothetical protein
VFGKVLGIKMRTKNAEKCILWINFMPIILENIRP